MWNITYQKHKLGNCCVAAEDKTSGSHIQSFRHIRTDILVRSESAITRGGTQMMLLPPTSFSWTTSYIFEVVFHLYFFVGKYFFEFVFIFFSCFQFSFFLRLSLFFLIEVVFIFFEVVFIFYFLGSFEFLLFWGHLNFYFF